MNSERVPHHSARRLAPTRLVLLTLTGALLAGTALMLGTAAPAAAKSFKPLAGWATLEGGSPVKGAAVRVYQGRTIKTKLRGPWSAARTYKTGTFGFDARKLPKTFVVAVSGGKIGSAPFPGTLRATIRSYRSPQTLYLNPVTTLLSVYLGRHPQVSIGKATTRVKRFLAIPAWQDIGADLQGSRTYFSGATFRSKAAKHGGFNRFVSVLADEVGRPGAKYPFPGTSLGAGAPSTTGWVANALAQGAISFAGGQALGWVLDQFGLGDGIADELAQIQAQLAQISAQLNTIENDVQQAKFSDLVAQSISDLSKIESGEAQLTALANLDPNDPDLAKLRTKLSNSLLAYIGGATSDKPCETGGAGVGLLGLQDDLNDRLVQSGTGTDGILVAGSRLTTRATRFWTSRTTAQVQSLFDYFATREAELLMLRVEFWHACDYAGSYIQGQIAKEQAQVAAQQSLQKAPPPTSLGYPAVFIDTATNVMWWNQATYKTYSPGEAQDFLDQINKDASYGFSDWTFSAGLELDKVFEGWSGSSPALWLNGLTGFNAFGVRYIWEGYYRKWDRYPWGVFDLAKADSTCQLDPSDPFFSCPAASMMPARRLTAGESYFYPPNP